MILLLLLANYIYNLFCMYNLNCLAPDTCILLAVHGLSWRVTTEFYKLLRGVLELNFGEFLVTLPETIPLEILQKPDTGCVSVFVNF